METEPKIIKVRRGNGFYYACDKDGYFICKFKKLGDIRKNYLKEIKKGQTTLVRELDKQADMSVLDNARKAVHDLLLAEKRKNKRRKRK